MGDDDTGPVMVIIYEKLLHGLEKGSHRFKYFALRSCCSKFESLSTPPEEPLAEIDPHRHSPVPVQTREANDFTR